MLVALLIILVIGIQHKSQPSLDEEYPTNPEWLNAKISQMETPVYYSGTVVYSYEWNTEYFYLISIGLSSCGMCEFYDYQGVKVEWTQEKIYDFEKNGKRIKVVWERKLGDETTTPGAKNSRSISAETI